MADVSVPLATTVTTLPVDMTKAPESVAAPIAESKPVEDTAATTTDATISTSGVADKEKPEEKTEKKTAVASSHESTASSDKPLPLTEPPAELPAPVVPTITAMNGDKKEELAVKTDSASATKDVDTKDAGAAGPAPVTAPAALATADAAVGEKRKVDDDNNESATAKNGVLPLTETPATETNGESAAKKAKTEAEAEAPASAPVAKTETGTEAPSATPKLTEPVKKTTRAKREKKVLPPFGRTARKTRSQGPVDA